MGFDERQAALRIAELMAENRQLRDDLSAAAKQLDSLRSENRHLQERLAELERASARQAAPFRREERKKVPGNQRKKPGRKPGHPGAYRQIPDHIDQGIEVPLPCCPHCQGKVFDRTPLVQFIEEIPPIRPLVTRLVTWQANCASMW